MSFTPLSHLPTAGLDHLVTLEARETPALLVFPHADDLPSLKEARLNYPYHCCVLSGGYGFGNRFSDTRSREEAREAAEEAEERFDCEAEARRKKRDELQHRQHADEFPIDQLPAITVDDWMLKDYQEGGGGMLLLFFYS